MAAPKAPPALHPKDSTRSHRLLSAIPPDRYHYRDIVIGCAVVVIAVIIVIYAQSFYAQPRRDLATAIQKFGRANQVQFNGKIEVRHSNHTDSVSIDFKAEKQPDLLYLDSVTRRQLNNRPLDVSSRLIVAPSGESYLKLDDTAFFDTLIESANPVSALQLIRTEAALISQADGKWLKFSPQEVQSLNQNNKAGAVADIIPQQACITGLLTAPSGENRQLLESIGSILADQTVEKHESKTIGSTPSTHYRIAVKSKSLSEAWSGLIASPHLKTFNQCVDDSGMADAPEISLDVWLADSGQTITRFHLTASTPMHTVTIISDVQYAYTTPKTIPDKSVNFGQLAVDNNQVEDEFVRRRLESFPHLNALLKTLQDDEALR